MASSTLNTVDIPKNALPKLKCKWCEKFVRPEFMFMLKCKHIYHHSCAPKADNVIGYKCCRIFSDVDYLRFAETEKWISDRYGSS